ncbi:MAG: nucleotide exchange factor GrpE [Gammaproteobacteria bacterium]|nr:nucleotide exchange factor GrpE [Gammaproteobacteria bacterium]MBP9729152.1 nucleotide exchange factor GrpE [Gammaproteobacteria bacterium]
MSTQESEELASKLEAATEDLNAAQAQSLEDLQRSLEEANRKASENWDLFLRARAEGDNIRRRAVLDVEGAHKYGIEKFARELLGVVDSLEQGLTMTATLGLEQEGTVQSLREGTELTHKLLLSLLEKFGIKALDPTGQAFDPEKHEALSTQPDASVEPNQVLMVIQKGYSLQDRLLRPARVIVSRKPENA